MADGSLHGYWLVPEATYATNPTNPVFANIPISKLSGGVSMTKIQDSTIRPDRQISDVRNGNITAKVTVDTTFRYGCYDLMLEALLGGTWDLGSVHDPVLLYDTVVQGVVFRSFLGERYFSDISDKPYFRHSGLEWDKLSLKVGKDSLIQATFSGQAQDEVDAASIVSGATYGALLDPLPFDSFTGGIKEGNATIATVTDFTLDISNNLEARPVIGSRLGLRPSRLLLNVSGSLTVHFMSAALFDKFKASTKSSLELTLTDPIGNNLTISVPNILYVSDAGRDVTGPGAILCALKFQAVLDPNTSNTIKIIRTPHVA